MPSRLRPFDLPLVGFGLAALWGGATAYDATAARARLLWIALGLLLYAVVSRLPFDAVWYGRRVRPLAIVVGLVTTGLAAWFFLTHDWTSPVAKVAWLDPLQHLLARRPWSPPWPAVPINMAGGVLACLLPLLVAAVWPTSEAAARPFWRLLLWLPVAVVALAVLMSRLRGGWLALSVSSAAVLWWRVCARSLGHGRRAQLIAGVTTIGAIALGAAGFIALDGDLPRPDRWQLWTNSWFLAWDYPVTGLGLGGFPMAYSSYALLVHVPHTMHAHQLFLDTWLDQGLVGVAAMTWLAWVGLSHPLSALPPHWALAARISWTATIVLGLVDDVHFGYGGVGALLLLLPIAVQAHGGAPTVVAKAEPISIRLLPAVISAGATALFVLIAMVPAMRAAVTANSAALAQTQRELAVYRWPAWPVQDALRRTPIVDAASLVEEYRQALALAPNASASMRLGQIELSLGDYESARAHLAAAYETAPSRPAVRQLLGEALAITGDVDGAANLWRTLPLGADQLQIREGWYRLIDEPQLAARIHQAAARATAR